MKDKTYSKNTFQDWIGKTIFLIMATLQFSNRAIFRAKKYKIAY